MPTAESAAVHRLKDILVEEVSLVDRAANKRRFLLVKRDADMSVLKSNGRGGFTRVAKAADEETDEEMKARKAAEEEAEEEKARKAAEDEEEKEKARKAGKPFPGAAKPFGAKPKEGETDEEKKKRVFEEEKTRKADASGKALAGQIRAHIEELEGLADELEEHEDEEPTDVHMKKLGGAHKKLGGMYEKFAKSDKTEKRGAKMAARRLDSFKAALSTLQSLLGELMETASSASEHEPEPGDPQKPARGWSPSNPSGVPTGSAGTAGGWTGGKRDDAEAILQKALAAPMAKLEELGAEIERLKRRPGGSNATSVEKGAFSRREPAAVSWPMDMTREVTRDNVDKSVSFFDD